MPENTRRDSVITPVSYGQPSTLQISYLGDLLGRIVGHLAGARRMHAGSACPAFATNFEDRPEFRLVEWFAVGIGAELNRRWRRWRERARLPFTASSALFIGSSAADQPTNCCGCLATISAGGRHWRSASSRATLSGSPQPSADLAAGRARAVACICLKWKEQHQSRSRRSPQSAGNAAYALAEILLIRRAFLPAIASWYPLGKEND